MLNKKYKIILIEPSDIITAGLQELIKPYKEFEIISVFADCDHYTDHIHRLHPDILIINPSVIDFKHRHCFETIFDNTEQCKRIALIYQYIEPEVLKHYHTSIDIRDHRDKIIKKLQQLALTTPSETEQTETNELSEREKEILISVAKGRINKEIAEEHHISIHTVITHRKNISRKTGIKSVAGLTVYALLNNLIDMSEVE
ncbi:MAG: LuxR C-terminal-related transcriptional regulator [Oscillibacter sp.]|nr:LuxR C-terminal-related transcriptional regulator [Oscillibacter sp.]